MRDPARWAAATLCAVPRRKAAGWTASRPTVGRQRLSHTGQAD